MFVKARAAQRYERRNQDTSKLIGDRKSTRLNSSHGYISYAVFCLKKKKKQKHRRYRDSEFTLVIVKEKYVYIDTSSGWERCVTRERKRVRRATHVLGRQ